MADRYVEPRWVEDDMSVWIPWNPETNKPGRSASGTALHCKVAVAAGHHARVVNQKYGVDRWYPLTSLYVPPTHPAAQ